jgi:putative CocE/NonD family hydrolase
MKDLFKVQQFLPSTGRRRSASTPTTTLWMHQSRASAPVFVAATVLAATTPAWAALEKGPCTVKKEADAAAKVRDGTVLLADVYRPQETGSYPVLLMRLPYNKDAAQTYVYAKPEEYASHCYIVVIQDVRGQYKSQGEFYPFRDEGKDGYDTVEWAAQLPGSNGKVGMYGFSYVGATQWLAAAEKPPHLVAIAPAHTSSDYYDGWSYEGGAFSLAFEQSWPLTSIAVSGVRRFGDQQLLDEIQQAAADLPALYKHLPLRDYLPNSKNDQRIAPYYEDWVTHDTWDDYWKQWSIRTRYQDIQVPALNFAGWYDVFMKGGTENFMGMREKGGSEVARKGQHLVIGPWIHLPWNQKVGEIDFGPEAANPIDRLHLRWFDYWLKGQANGVDAEQPVRVFVMGANTWRKAESWPIPGTQFTPYYLQSLGQANTRFGNGSLTPEKPPAGQASDRYRYDPANPVPSAGGHSCCTSDVAPVGPYDQAKIEERADVLVYTTAPLQQAVEVTGPIQVILYAKSSAPDTDFTAKLVDIHPDDKLYNLGNGIIRASSRESLERRTPIEPDRTYEYKIDLWPTSNLFQPGHRIGLEISSSNFPHYDRNPNTGAEFGQGTALKVADQTILHDAENPSRIILPIVPVPIR